MLIGVGTVSAHNHHRDVIYEALGTKRLQVRKANVDDVLRVNTWHRHDPFREALHTVESPSGVAGLGKSVSVNSELAPWLDDPLFGMPLTWEGPNERSGRHEFLKNAVVLEERRRMAGVGVVAVTVHGVDGGDEGGKERFFEISDLPSKMGECLTGIHSSS